MTQIITTYLDNINQRYRLDNATEHTFRGDLQHLIKALRGYQPAQKWLKDRRERTLGFEDILHYQKIIVVLFETDRIMKEIDTITVM